MKVRNTMPLSWPTSDELDELPDCEVMLDWCVQRRCVVEGRIWPRRAVRAAHELESMPDPDPYEEVRGKRERELDMLSARLGVEVSGSYLQRKAALADVAQARGLDTTSGSVAD